jgi:hypothetical protein
MGISSIVRKHAPALTVALFALPLAPTAADTLFSNPTPFDGFANCVFNTACGNVWAAQKFSLASSAVLSSASFTDITQDPNFTYTIKLPTAVNWSLWQANGPNGLPGTVVAQGSNDAIVSSQEIDDFTHGKPYFEQTFNLPSVSLQAGNY